jgi:hypothetical protein
LIGKFFCAKFQRFNLDCFQVFKIKIRAQLQAEVVAVGANTPAANRFFAHRAWRANSKSWRNPTAREACEGWSLEIGMAFRGSMVRRETDGAPPIWIRVCQFNWAGAGASPRRRLRY